MQDTSWLANSAPKGHAILGFDGFVDEITHVVDMRETVDTYSRIRTMEAFGERIKRSAGRNANLEYVTMMTKMGGNATIMANALSLLGVPLTCIGTMGKDNPHSVYQDLATRSKIVSLGEPARTEALEFDDGKLITSKLEALNAVTWEQIVDRYPVRKLIEAIDQCLLFAPMNWTMLPHMGDILAQLALIVVPELSRDRTRYLYIDLADPEKRSARDLKHVVRTLTRFTGSFQVILGANTKELELICRACTSSDMGGDRERATWLIHTFGISMVVVHSREKALCIRRGGVQQEAAAMFTPTPRISTGAGDNFNAGFCYGLMSHLSDRQCLELGCAVAGYYVRNAISPDRDTLIDFLHSAEIQD